MGCNGGLRSAQGYYYELLLLLLLLLSLLYYDYYHYHYYSGARAEGGVEDLLLRQLGLVVELAPHLPIGVLLCLLLS